MASLISSVPTTRISRPGGRPDTGRGCDASVTDVIPTGMDYVPGSLNVVGGTGIASDLNDPELTWGGVLSPTTAVILTYQATVVVGDTMEITNTATIDAPGYQTITETATILINPYERWFPFVLRSFQ